MLHEIGMPPLLLGFFGGMGMQEMAIIGVIAILLFGKNLPNVARTLGKSYGDFSKPDQVARAVARTLGKNYGDFRRGLSDIQSEFQKATREVEDSVKNGYSSKSSATTLDDYDDFEEATAPKFEPPPQPMTPEKSEST